MAQWMIDVPAHLDDEQLWKLKQIELSFQLSVVCVYFLCISVFIFMFSVVHYFRDILASPILDLDVAAPASIN
jgi:cytochrome c biogenesis protein CcdA